MLYYDYFFVASAVVKIYVSEWGKTSSGTHQQFKLLSQVILITFYLLALMLFDKLQKKFFFMFTSLLNCIFLKSFVPSGMSESPLMTWGEIESTPFRLDGSNTPYVERNHGPSFKVPNIQRRNH